MMKGKGKPKKSMSMSGTKSSQNSSRNTNVSGGTMPSMGPSKAPMQTSGRGAKVS